MKLKSRGSFFSASLNLFRLRAKTPQFAAKMLLLPTMSLVRSLTALWGEGWDEGMLQIAKLEAIKVQLMRAAFPQSHHKIFRPGLKIATDLRLYSSKSRQQLVVIKL